MRLLYVFLKATSKVGHAVGVHGQNKRLNHFWRWFSSLATKIHSMLTQHRFKNGKPFSHSFRECLQHHQCTKNGTVVPFRL